MTAPLDSITVLDLTQIYNGPYATFLLAQAGAEVIKVEPPHGEHLRQRSGNTGAALPFAMLNANKLAVTLNLKTPTGLAMLKDLLPRADVLVENFAPGVMERLGLGWDVLHAANPRLIYAASSGYGSDGPYRDFPAMDLVMQAMTGVIGITGAPDQPPVKAGPAICDFITGVHLYGAITTALVQRGRTGLGCAVEVSMMESIYASLASNLGLYYGSGGKAPPRTGNRHGGMSLAPYNVYPASDGWVAIICNNDTHWRALLATFDNPGLADNPDFRTVADRARNMDALDEIIAGWTSKLPRQELFERLVANQVPAGPVRSLAEVVEDPHLHARGALQWVDHPQYGRIVVQASPLRFRDAEPMEHRFSRPLGADNAAVFSRYLDLDADAVAALAARGVL